MKVTNATNLPKTFFRGCERAVNNHPDMADNEFSVTELMKGIKEIVLSRKHKDDLTIDAQDALNIFFGVAVHYYLALDADEEDLSEARFSLDLGKYDKELEGYVLSGSPDFYNRADQYLWDYKTTKVAKYNKSSTLAEKEWLYQLQTYALMLKLNGNDVNHISDLAMLKDHSAIRANINGHPSHPVNVVDYSAFLTDENLTATMDYLCQRAKEVVKALKLKDDEIPPCTPEERYDNSDWAILKTGRKNAVRANLSCKEEAEQVLASIADKTGLYIQYRQGDAERCKRYCSCKQFCNFYKENFGKGEEDEQTHRTNG